VLILPEILSSYRAAGTLEQANEKLASYGLPPILFVPPGFAPLVSEYGRGNNNEPMVIKLMKNHPL
jgi:hypothetical protein